MGVFSHAGPLSDPHGKTTVPNPTPFLFSTPLYPGSLLLSPITPHSSLLHLLPQPPLPSRPYGGHQWRQLPCLVCSTVTAVAAGVGLATATVAAPLALPRAYPAMSSSGRPTAVSSGR